MGRKPNEKKVAEEEAEKPEAEETQGEEGTEEEGADEASEATESESQPEKKPEVKKAEKPVAAGRKPHWPKGFVPTGDKVKDTKALLDAEDKVSFMVPLMPEEKPGMEEIVQVNGHKYTIKKGHMVEVPKTVAMMLARKYRIELAVMQMSQANSSEAKAAALAG